MHSLDSRLDFVQLLEDARKLSYLLDGSGVFMAYAPNGGISHEVANNSIAKALEEISLLRGRDVIHVMVNCVLPGITVPKHRDFLLPTPLQSRRYPTIERWHLPLQTNDFALWWDDEGGERHFPYGKWTGYIPYWILHQIWNLGSEERVHLVVDLDTPEHLGEYQK